MLALALAACGGGGGGTPAPVNDGAAAFAVSGNANKELIAVVQSADPDGNGTFSYKWEKSADGTTNWTEVATSASYTPQSGDAYIRLAEVTYTDGDGFSESITPSDNVVKLYLTGTATGSAGRDYIIGGETSARGGAGDDFLYGDTSDNGLVGQEGNDTLYGGAGSDSLYGNAGDDTIYGGDGLDYFLGGAGSDTMTGGAGDDRFYLEIADGSRGKDIVTDFKANGDSDILRFDIDDSLLASVTSTDTITSVAGIGWTNDSNDSGTSANDTIISYLGDDKAVGGEGDNADEIIVVLEDYSTELVFADFLFV